MRHRNIFYWGLLCLSMLLMTSCGTTKSVNSGRMPTRNSRTQHTSSKPGDMPKKPGHKPSDHRPVTIDDEWATLTLKLSRSDNRLLYNTAREWLGVPYRYGGEDFDGTDCSGLVMNLYEAVYGIDLERNSAKIFENNCKPIDKDALREGDLVFFITGKADKISHVGLYLKDGKFIHASSSKGVIVSDLDQRYYREHYATAGRVITKPVRK